MRSPAKDVGPIVVVKELDIIPLLQIFERLFVHEQAAGRGALQQLSGALQIAGEQPFDGILFVDELQAGVEAAARFGRPFGGELREKRDEEIQGGLGAGKDAGEETVPGGVKVDFRSVQLLGEAGGVGILVGIAPGGQLEDQQGKGAEGSGYRCGQVEFLEELKFTAARGCVKGSAALQLGQHRLWKDGL